MYQCLVFGYCRLAFDLQKLNEIIMISEAAGLSGYFDSKVDWLEYGLVLAKSKLEVKSLEIQIESAKVEQFKDC